MARPAGDIAARVIEAARARFLAEGVDGASLRAIARDAGTNLGMVYYYYPTKDALFLAVVEGAYAGLLDDLSRVLGEAGEGTGERLERLFERLAQLSDTEADVIRLILREAMGSSERIRQLFARFSRGHIPLIMGLLTSGQARGEVRSDVPLLALTMAALAAGLVPQVLRRALAQAGLPMAEMLPQPEALADLLARVVTQGIAPAPPRPR